MSYISYAQNYEDVMLRRALKSVDEGFYVDIGAQHPTLDSVSKLFYENGWRGISVEPVPEFAALLRGERPEDVVLEVAVGYERESRPLHVFKGTGVSTFLNEYANSYQSTVPSDRSLIYVPVVPLDRILEEHGKPDIHWLKVDVEGCEDEVLGTLDLARFCPWIIVVEACFPNSNVQTDLSWEPRLIENGYEFVYFDGLNRFYVASEHSELKAAFAYPPNVLDGFVSYVTNEFHKKSIQLEGAVVPELRRQIESLQLNFETQRGMLEEVRNDCAVRDKALADLQSERNALLDKLGKANSDKTQALERAERLQSLAAQNETLVNELRAASERAEKLQSLAAQNETLVNELRAVSERKDDAIATLNFKLGKSLESLPPLQKLVSEKDSVIEAMAVEMTSYKANSTTMYAKLYRETQALSRRLKEAEAASEESERTLREIKQALEERMVVAYQESAHAIHVLECEKAANLEEINRLHVAYENKARELDLFLASKSWQITKPLRNIVDTLGGLRRLFRSGKYKHKSVAAATAVCIPQSAVVSTAGQEKERKRILYFYVNHTCTYEGNTGVQRVSRQLARTLQEQGEDIRFVKWSSSLKSLAYITPDEYRTLAKWGGPDVSSASAHYYCGSDPSQQGVTPMGGGDDDWLIIPEVTHIGVNDSSISLDIMTDARRLQVKTACIFYDAIPLLRPEFKAISLVHQKYMQHLLLADLVVPISYYSAEHIALFLKGYERADDNSIPTISALPLAGEVLTSERVTRVGKQHRKMILSVGSIDIRKNQLAMVEAFAELCERSGISDWRLVLVGNISPDLAPRLDEFVAKCPHIEVRGHLADEEVEDLYSQCAFTVFPSIEEGFGLPILESLWHGKPSICANFGAMAEVAVGGGCLMIDTKSVEEIAGAMESLMRDTDKYDDLVRSALTRHIKSWGEYGREFSNLLTRNAEPLAHVGTIYYWIDHTSIYGKNSGIQRVTRMLAKALLDVGVSLIPVTWDREKRALAPTSLEQLNHFALWNGPAADMWSEWSAPAGQGGDWLLVPELTTYLPHGFQDELAAYTKSVRMRTAYVFYDTIPWKQARFYPPEATNAHANYMLKLNLADVIFPISHYSREALLEFYSVNRARFHSAEDRIVTAVLPGEFTEAERIRTIKTPGDTVKILCVGTIEPRKNHLCLMEAFSQLIRQTDAPVELVLAGNNPFPELEEKVRVYIKKSGSIKWITDADDTRLRELYSECDFTVYPSVEEGFGLPILESLWNARPCICGDMSAMAEVAADGGCLAVDVTRPEEICNAMLQLVQDQALRQRLAEEAVEMDFKTWQDYAREVARGIGHVADSLDAFKPQTESGLPVEAAIEVLPELKARPKLSICISTYNRSKWLNIGMQNLLTLLPVPHEDIEIVVCDNASTDDTQSMMGQFLTRPDVKYYRNAVNVGMLGNLKVTTNHAEGEYVWILGDDDLPKPGTIERVLDVIRKNAGISLVYLNYAYTREENPSSVEKIGEFLESATPIVEECADKVGKIYEICAQSENFFTAIYCVIFRRDHAIKAYSQYTGGRPFSTLLTCIPTTYYVLNYMMQEQGYWIGSPQLVVNMNVSWMRYASLWILERIPETYDLAERMGAKTEEIDRWRIHTLPGVKHFWREMYTNDSAGNAEYFSPLRSLLRMKHLAEFDEISDDLASVYRQAYDAQHPQATIPPEILFPSS